MLYKTWKKNLILVSAYIHDASSTYYNSNIFEELSLGITEFCDDITPFLIMGDLNSRTGTHEEKFSDPQIECISQIDTSSDSIALSERKNCDRTVNAHGEKILDICRTFNLIILNSRTSVNPLGAFTYCDPNLGSSTIDYGICNQSFFSNIKNFMTLPQNLVSLATPF